jgi:hypothetical protein
MLARVDFHMVRNLWGSPFIDRVALNVVNTIMGCYLCGIEGYLREHTLLWVAFLYHANGGCEQL